jgi:hypothetical protein
VTPEFSLGVGPTTYLLLLRPFVDIEQREGPKNHAAMKSSHYSKPPDPLLFLQNSLYVAVHQTWRGSPDLHVPPRLLERRGHHFALAGGSCPCPSYLEIPRRPTALVQRQSKTVSDHCAY